MPLDYGTEAALTANNAVPQATLFDATSTSNNSITFDVNKEPYYVESFNLGGGDTITIQQVAGSGAGAVFQNFAPLGVALQLTSTVSKVRIDWPGRYRLVFAGASVAAIYCIGHAGTMTHNTIYKTAAAQGGSGGGGGGFTLTPSNTSSVDLVYSGSTSAGSLSANANISADAGNAVSIHSDGLFASSGGGGSFNMPFTAESGNFTVGNTYHAYESSSDATATLPSPASSAGQVYLASSNYYNGFGITFNPGGNTINGYAGSIVAPAGMTALAYSSGSDFLLANYVAISSAAGNLLKWNYRQISTDGLYVSGVNPVQVPSASNTSGTVTLVAGTAVVTTASVTANSRIFLTAQSLGTVTVGQGLAISARTAGTSFTIKSESATDTSVVAWLIVEPV